MPHDPRQPEDRPASVRRRWTIAAGLALTSVVMTWVLHDVPVLHRGPMLISVFFACTSLAFGGFWPAMLTFVPGLVAAILFLIGPAGGYPPPDPIELQRIAITVLLVVFIAAIITTLRVDRDRLRARSRELSESEERYRNLLEQASDPIFVADDDGGIRIVNRAACELLGYDRDALIGRNLREIISPESLAAQPYRGAELRDRPLVAAEREMVRRDGSRVIVEVTARRTSNGLTQGIARDVTERRRTEERMRRIEVQLQTTQRLEALGRLAAGVAHDYNNILTVITSHAQLLALELAPRDGAEHAKRILEAGERAAALSRQLLAFSRRQSMSLRELDLRGVLRGIEPILRQLAGNRAELIIRSDDDVPRVWADASQIEQVLVNLVVNARDAVDSQGRIEVSLGRIRREAPDPEAHDATTPVEYARLTVRDDGIGMDAATRARIFEPFFTTKPEGQGTGLGLATVFGIVSQSGGFIQVDSTPGAGSTFEVHLPAIAAVSPTMVV